MEALWQDLLSLELQEWFLGWLLLLNLTAEMWGWEDKSLTVIIYFSRSMQTCVPWCTTRRSVSGPEPSSPCCREREASCLCSPGACGGTMLRWWRLILRIYVFLLNIFLLDWMIDDKRIAVLNCSRPVQTRALGPCWWSRPGCSCWPGFPVILHQIWKLVETSKDDTFFYCAM